MKVCNPKSKERFFGYFKTQAKPRQQISKIKFFVLFFLKKHTLILILKRIEEKLRSIKFHYPCFEKNVRCSKKYF